MRKLAISMGVTYALFDSNLASAHLRLTYPPPRYAEDDLKDRPCGIPNGMRSRNVERLQAGQTIEITWEETVEHSGHFRIAFDADGDDDFVDPEGYEDFYTNDAVMHDDIEDKDVYVEDPSYSFEITLPDIACDNCTLQVIQVMTDKKPYGPPLYDDIYYQCADLVLEQRDGGSDGTGTGNVEASNTDGHASTSEGEITGGGDDTGGYGSTTDPGTTSMGDDTSGVEQGATVTSDHDEGAHEDTAHAHDTTAAAEGADTADLEQDKHGCHVKPRSPADIGSLAVLLFVLGRTRSRRSRTRLPRPQLQNVGFENRQDHSVPACLTRSG